LKSYLSSKSISLFQRFKKSSFFAISKSLSLFKIFIASCKLSIGTTSIQGIIDASKEFSLGINIFLNHFSLAHMVAGNIEATFLSLPSKDNSHKNIDSFIKKSSMNHSFTNIAIAIGKSKLGHDFLISAGAKLTVILVIGNFVLEDFIADLNLSLLSCTH
jgi:hypothetical protein